MIFLLAFACDMPQPAPPPAKPKAPACELSLATLGGTSWLYLKPQEQGPDKPDPTARMRFRDEGGALKADYTAGSTSDVLNYACTSDGKIATCVESNPYTDAFCKGYAAVHDGVCDPAEVSRLTGIPLDVTTTAAKTVNAELKKLKGDAIALQRKSDNNRNNKMRGKFLVAIDKARCGLTVVDKYITMFDGAVHEFENVIGTARFAKSDTNYTWESCKDADAAWAPGPDDKHLAVQQSGTIKFSAILQKDQRKGVAAACTLTADVYADWVRTASDVPSVPDVAWGPRWNTQVSLSESGKHVIYFDRYKTCDGKKERIGMTCAQVRVE